MIFHVNNNSHISDCKSILPQKILITGSSGLIGKQICPYLSSHGFSLRGFDRKPLGMIDEEIKGQLEDLAALRCAAAGVDTIIHLAACSDDADFVTNLVPSNVIGLYNTFEAARLENIHNFIFASSCQAADLQGRCSEITVEDRFPTDHYGLTKLWAEDLGRLYSWRFGLSVLVVRLGWVLRSKSELKKMLQTPGGKELFLSYRDLKEFFNCTLRMHPKTAFSIIYALSRQINREIFDMKPTRDLIGFEPKDIFSEILAIENINQNKD